MLYFCQDAPASFLSNPGTKIDGCYYHNIVLIQQMLPSIRSIAGDTNVFQQDSAPVHVWWSSSFSVKLLNSLLQTYGLQIVLILTLWTVEYEMLCGIVFITHQFETWPIWSSTWLTHGLDCRRVSLMIVMARYIASYRLSRYWGCIVAYRYRENYSSNKVNIPHFSSPECCC